MRRTALILLLASMRFMAQPDSNSLSKKIRLPGNSGNVALFTVVESIPLSEPPLPMARFGVVLLGPTDNEIARIETERATGFFTREVIRVHSRPTVLMGVNTVDGPGKHLYAVQLEGKTLLKGDWKGSRINYQVTKSGDLRVIAFHDDFVRWVPTVRLWSGEDQRPDLELERDFARSILKENSDKLGEFPPGATRSPKFDNCDRFGDVGRICAEIANAAAVLEDPAQVLKICGPMKTKITELPLPKECEVYRGLELRGLDNILERADDSLRKVQEKLRRGELP